MSLRQKLLKSIMLLICPKMHSSFFLSLLHKTLLKSPDKMMVWLVNWNVYLVNLINIIKSYFHLIIVDY